MEGVDYSATETVGKFTGTATGVLPGAWTATVIHDPVDPAAGAPITGGSFSLYSYRTIRGTFTGGTVKPINMPTICVNEQFAVSGTLKLADGSPASFQVVLTHLRTTIGTRCITYGATVAGTLTFGATSAAAAA